MGDGTEEDEEVPDGVVVGAVVVGEEIGACCVGDAFGEEEPEGGRGQGTEYRPGNEDDAPPHDEVDGEREPWVAAQGDYLVDGSGDDGQPLQGKDGPAEPAAYDSHEDGGVGAGYHDVDADVVALAQDTLQPAAVHPMVGCAAEEHEEHSDEEADDSEQHLWADLGCQPHEPYAAQSKDDSDQVSQDVSPLPAPPLGECFAPASTH